MITVLLLVKVQHEKKREFLLSMRGFAPTDLPGYAGLRILQSVDDQDTVCCLLHWESDRATRDYLASDLYGAMRGAARSLGEHSEWHLLRHTDAESLDPTSLSEPNQDGNRRA